MYDKAEADYTELSSKKRIVEADRKKIEKVLPSQHQYRVQLARSFATCICFQNIYAFCSHNMLPHIGPAQSSLHGQSGASSPNDQARYHMRGNVGMQLLRCHAWQVIAELDEKKREALHKTWLKVNQDFGSIFSTLLPGTSAKLEPPEGQDYLAGGVWLALKYPVVVY